MSASRSRRLASLEALRAHSGPPIGFIVRDVAGHVIHTTPVAPVMIEISADEWRL
jgi:hypothetical protein